ncbi:MAG: aminotransferase class I/II-fold pyridoxal phosphate-dependent enzyme, partial [Spirochaetia bacterium]|nr:aminotransferase class I/II-fold pyridoxal phosphate-dependent enzyme [Spirochaetia bacterium]
MPDRKSGDTSGDSYWNSKLCSQIISMPPSGIRVFFDIVAQKKGVISLGVGEPDFVTPQIIVNTAIESLRNGYTYYTGNAGLISLRRAIATFLSESFEVDYDPDQEILITVGVSQGVDLAI